MLTCSSVSLSCPWLVACLGLVWSLAFLVLDLSWLVLGLVLVLVLSGPWLLLCSLLSSFISSQGIASLAYFHRRLTTRSAGGRSAAPSKTKKKRGLHGSVVAEVPPPITTTKRTSRTAWHRGSSSAARSKAQ